MRVAEVLGEPPDRFVGPEDPVTLEMLHSRLEEVSELLAEALARLEAGIDRVEKQLSREAARGRASR